MSYTKIEFPKEKKEFYSTLNLALKGLIDGDKFCTTAMANASALLFDALPEVNWAGFYMRNNEKLYLAPFQGKPACTEILIGKGVCGTAAYQKKTQVVEDVHLFPGHIACDSASNSEIVVPLIIDNEVIGVLDIDSPYKGSFSNEDAKGLEEFCRILLDSVDFTNYSIG